VTEGRTELLAPELLQRISGLVVAARRAVEGALSGMHASAHRGASVVFVEHREYRPGDDPRLLDWRAYARTDRHTIKRFEQETQLRATLVLDRSGSMRYGRTRLVVGGPERWDPAAGVLPGDDKAEYGALLLTALAHLLLRQGDAAGALTFDATPGIWVPPRSRPNQLDAVAATLLAPGADHAATALRPALGAVVERAGRRGLVVVASDLLDLQPDALEPLGRLVARGHEVVVLHVLHPDELEFPFDQPTRFVGTEGEAPVEVDAASVAKAYRAEAAAFVARMRETCGAAGARYVLARTDRPPETTLARAVAVHGRGVWV
jgi:uncharacterized protein (DUF58 family)